MTYPDISNPIHGNLGALVSDSPDHVMIVVRNNEGRESQRLVSRYLFTEAYDSILAGAVRELLGALDREDRRGNH